MFSKWIIATSAVAVLIICACQESNPTTVQTTDQKPDNDNDYVVYEGDIRIPKSQYEEWLTTPKMQPEMPSNLVSPNYSPKHAPIPLAKTAQQQTSSIVSTANIGNITIQVDPSVPAAWIPYIDRAISQYQELSNSTSIRVSRVASGGKILITMNNLGTTGPCMDAQFPSGGNPGTPVRINSAAPVFMGNSALWTPAIIHEIGHTLGLMHTETSGGLIPTTPNQQTASIMQGGTCNSPALGFTAYDHHALVYLYPPAGTRPFMRWWFGSINKHFYSVLTEGLLTDPTNAAGSPDFYEGNAGLLYTAPGSGLTAVYRFVNTTNNDHYYTTNYSDGSTKSGYQYEFLAGYINNTQVAGTVPFYRYWNATIGNHFMDFTPPTASGYVSDGQVGYMKLTPW